ncbi:hypothetical protein AHAS_Ahas05G0153600 [Arachis hypogaea]
MHTVTLEENYVKFCKPASKSPKHKRYRNYRNSLQDMQSKLNETNALLVKERENVKKVTIEATPVM